MGGEFAWNLAIKSLVPIGELSPTDSYQSTIVYSRSPCGGNFATKP
ncbi:hypothetical protein ACTFOF_25250 [Bacillus cereus group sp. MYBK87-2]